MVAPLSRLVSGTNVLLFGSQALAFNEESFRHLRSTLLDSPDNRWSLDIIAKLPGYWDPLSKSVSKLQHFPGAKLLQELNDWLKTGEVTQASFPLPNILLTPLVVITQLTQYSRFLELAQPDCPEPRDLHASFKHNAETVGLCTGLLSALAVSSSGNQAQLQHYGAVAVRLAMLIGALVDAQDTSADLQGESKSFSVAWNSLESGLEVTAILQRFPEVRRLPSLLDRMV